MSISEQIKQSLKDIKTIKEATNAQLDIISADIVAIEKELSEQFTRMPYIYTIDDDIVYEIAWDIDDIPSKKPKFRLLIQYKTRDLSVIRKPMVEIPSSIRLIAYKYIPEFIKGYGEFILRHSKELENVIKG